MDLTEALLSFFKSPNRSQYLNLEEPLGIALSGGPDSMALAHAMIHMNSAHGLFKELILFTVDHNLRHDSTEEAAKVQDWVKEWPGCRHHILQWEHDRSPDDASLQEEARQARYHLITQACKELGIKSFLTAHHMDDQAETILFRLSKGSGLDGLGGIPPETKSHGVTLLRPLLSHDKDALIAYCEERKLPYIQDPTNDNIRYMRARMRNSYAVLAKEGLTSERLSKTAERLRRAREALDYYTAKAFDDCLIIKDTNRIEYKKNRVLGCPHEITVRLFQKAFALLNPADDYGPRYKKLEGLVSDLVTADHFEKRTLGGLIIEEKRPDETYDVPRIVFRHENSPE